MRIRHYDIDSGRLEQDILRITLGTAEERRSIGFVTNFTAPCLPIYEKLCEYFKEYNFQIKDKGWKDLTSHSLWLPEERIGQNVPRWTDVYAALSQKHYAKEQVIEFGVETSYFHKEPDKICSYVLNWNDLSPEAMTKGKWTRTGIVGVFGPNQLPQVQVLLKLLRDHGARDDVFTATLEGNDVQMYRGEQQILKLPLDDGTFFNRMNVQTALHWLNRFNDAVALVPYPPKV